MLHPRPRFTVLLPVHRPPDLLPYAVASVQRQQRRDFELFIICDGPPRATVEMALALARQDRRIRVFDRPKGARHGEAWRHEALQEARGDFVCQISDDDLWLPDHLDEVALLLAEAEFGNLPQVHAIPGGGLWLFYGSLNDPAQLQALAEGKRNFFGPTVAAYRLETYRRLPEGWAPAPDWAATDHHMWMKFLRLPELRAATRYAFTALHFATPRRVDWPLARRQREMADWAASLATPEGRGRFRQRLLHHLLVERHDGALQQSLDEEVRRRRAVEEQLARQHEAVRKALARDKGG